MVLQVLEFDLRSCGGDRALLVTSSAAIFDDGEVRRSTPEERRVFFWVEPVPKAMRAAS